MQTLIANIKYAVRNNETTIIGGGEPQGQLEFDAMHELNSIINNKG